MEELNRVTRIKKAVIVDELFLEVQYTEELPGHNTRKITSSSTIPVHEDLKAAFDKLHVHLALLADQEKHPAKKDIEAVEFEGYTAKGFTKGGKTEEEEGVTIIGNKEGKYGIVNINTPFAKYASSPYPFIDQLSHHIETAVYEVEQFLYEGKRAPERQLEMEFLETVDEGEGAE